MSAILYHPPATALRVVAIDPGYDKLGVAVLERKNGIDQLLYSNCLRTEKGSFEKRLFTLGTSFEQLVQKWQPDVFAIEKLFFTTNQKTALAVAEVKGMLSYLAACHHLSYAEFTPLQVKIAVTGYGRANKRQVIDMLPRLIRIEKRIRYDDEYDAIAVGLTYLASRR